MYHVHQSKEKVELSLYVVKPLSACCFSGIVLIYAIFSYLFII